MTNKIGKMIKTIVGLSVFLLFLGIKIDAAAAPKTMPDGGIFDAEYYAQNNPDVVAVLGTDENVLYQHYLTSGRLEGRKPYADNVQAGAGTGATTGAYVTLPDGTIFDATYYAAAYPDVAAVIGTDALVLAQHYTTSGKAEGRKPNAGTVNTTIPVQQPVQTTPQQPAQPAQTVRETPTPAQSNSITYVLNTNTHKFHLPGCSSVREIKPGNRVDSCDSRDDIIAAGYVACKRCHP